MTINNTNKANSILYLCGLRCKATFVGVIVDVHTCVYGVSNAIDRLIKRQKLINRRTERWIDVVINTCKSSLLALANTHDWNTRNLAYSSLQVFVICSHDVTLVLYARI